jgi:hypothetical protein
LKERTIGRIDERRSPDRRHDAPKVVEGGRTFGLIKCEES